MHAAAAGNILAAMSDLDGFTAKLNAILQADLTHAALAAGPLEVAPNLMQQLGSVLAVEGGAGGGGGGAGGLSSPDTDALLKQLKALQEQVALLDRIQNIRWVGGRVGLGGRGLAGWLGCPGLP